MKIFDNKPLLSLTISPTSATTFESMRNSQNRFFLNRKQIMPFNHSKYSNGFPLQLEQKIKVPTTTYKFLLWSGSSGLPFGFYILQIFIFYFYRSPHHSISATLPTLWFPSCTYCPLCLKGYSQNIHLAHLKLIQLYNCTLCLSANIIT